jgi:rSAM/selenodomain-associated transferase 2
MITVIMPTLDAETSLAAAMSALVPAVVEGIVREVIVVDGGSSDRTIEIADAAGAEVMTAERGRGSQMRAGAAAARFPWLLFLHSDTVLEPGWQREAAAFIDRVDGGARPEAAAAFAFALDDTGIAPRLVEFGVRLRTSLLRLPYGDQGLLVPRRLYDSIGGFAALPLMEDVEIRRRLGRSRTIILRSRAVTSAYRYRRDGYLLRVVRNLTCLLLYLLRVPPRVLVRIYG